MFTCFIEIISILAKTLAQLKQAVNEANSNFLLRGLKMKFFSSLTLKNYRNHLRWKLSWTPSQKGFSGGKGERWKRERERAEGEKRLIQMLLLEPSAPTQRDSIPSNQNHFRSLGCQLHVSKSSPKINLNLRSGRPSLLVLLRFRFFSETSNVEFSNTCDGTSAVFEEL